MSTVREQVAEAIVEAINGPPGSTLRDGALDAADAAIAIIVELYRNGEAGRLDEEVETEKGEGS